MYVGTCIHTHTYKHAVYDDDFTRMDSPYAHYVFIMTTVDGHYHHMWQ